MSTGSVLGSVTLAYEAIWNQWRQCAGVRLLVEPNRDIALSGAHLLAALSELWPAKQGALLVRPANAALLFELLSQAPVPGLWIEAPHQWLQDARFAAQARQAGQRGVPVVWSGEPGQSPTPDVLRSLHTAVRALTHQEALVALRTSLHQHQSTRVGAQASRASPVHPGALYEGLASAALVDHALDHQGALGVVGWPTDEVLHGYRFKQIQPAHALVMAMVQAIDADASLDSLERQLGHEPLLTYRYLRYANSVAVGLPREMDSVRHALMAMGYAQTRNWLMAQLPHASNEANLNPIRSSMVVRARTMAQLADAGMEEDLRREVFLCGVLSQVDLLLGEPLGPAIQRLPLTGRIVSALLGQAGPYAPWLAIASAQESGSAKLVRELCKAHGLSTEEVNRALLRALAQKS
ncbi:HDOD domain-containing protein [Rhodoferax aquaticus]|uniref:HDOD domain-containing protein n=1 Tax=Rhodoferax aquaticus TaxID=2527691 RepID=A0A515EU24_9BURK|nr:HDOD domain-containing protein [Rhodoferax aquaticus]QDL56118.1 HDOD domain-containing protein [Rhodoferax aquaticus]